MKIPSYFKVKLLFFKINKITIPIIRIYLLYINSCPLRFFNKTIIKIYFLEMTSDVEYNLKGINNLKVRKECTYI